MAKQEQRKVGKLAPIVEDEKQREKIKEKSSKKADKDVMMDDSLVLKNSNEKLKPVDKDTNILKKADKDSKKPKKIKQEKNNSKKIEKDFFIDTISKKPEKDELSKKLDKTDNDSKEKQSDEEDKTSLEKKPAEDVKQKKENHEETVESEKDKTAKKNTKKKKKSLFSFLNKQVGGQKDSDFIIENLSLLLSSGISMISSLEAIRAETKNKQLQEKIDQLKIQIEDGSSLWRALEKLDLAQKNTIALIKIGEESGRLTENLKVVATQQEKDRSFKQKVLTAMLYPVIVLGMTVVIGVGIAWFILPRLTSVFSSLSLDLPLITRIVIWIGKFLAQWGIIVVPGFILALIIGFYFLFFHESTKKYGQTLLFKVPGIKGLLMEIELARFGFIMGQLLEAGLPISESLNSLVETSTNIKYKEIFSTIKENIDDGATFKETFARIKDITNYMPIGVQQMVISAEQSGNLPEVLKKIGSIYEEKSEFSTKNLAVIIEPILLFVVWGGVLIVALSVIIPIYSLVGGIGKVSNPTQNESTAPAEVSTETPEAQASTSPTISATPKISSTPSESPAPTEDAKQQIEILSTETGYLNVRTEPSASSDIVTRVNPGEIYDYTDQQDDWYKIEMPNDQSGWVFGDYVKKL